MSQEAIGENEAVLGSSQYWNRVNRSTFFGGLMGRPSETNYHETLREVGGRAGDMVEEIYADLQEHKKQLSCMASDRRNLLAKQVRGCMMFAGWQEARALTVESAYPCWLCPAFSAIHSAMTGRFKMPSEKSRIIQISFPASAWSYFKKPPTGAFPLPQAAMKKTGVSGRCLAG